MLIVASKTNINKRYHYDRIKGVQINQYMAAKITEYRQIKRLNRPTPKWLAKEIPDEVVTEIKELHDSANLSYRALARMYGLTPYLVKTVIEKNASSEKRKSLCEHDDLSLATT